MKYLFFIPMLLVTIMIALLWLDLFLGLMFIVALFWVSIPAIVFAIYITIKSWRCSNTFQKIIVGWSIFNILFLIVYIRYREPQQVCSPSTMVEHYEKHAADLDKLVQYTANALDDSASMLMDFEMVGMSRLRVSAKNDSVDHVYSSSDAGKVEMDSIMKIVGLTAEEFQNIRSFLKKYGCCGIKMGKSHLEDEVMVIFRYVGFSTNAFLLYYRPLTEDEKKRFMYDDRYIPYNEKMILYHSATVGAETFLKEEKEEFLSKHKPW